MYSHIRRLPWHEFWEALSRSRSRALLAQHDDLSARPVLLHAAMGLNDLVEVAGSEEFFAVRVASRRGDEGAAAFSDGRGRQTNRGGAAANQQALAFFKTKRLEQRAPSRLQHLRDGSERFPGEFGLDDLHLCRWHAGEFGVAAVELPSHAAHSGRDDIALAQLASWR